MGQVAGLRLDRFQAILERIGAGEPVRETLDHVAELVSELAGFDFCAVLLRGDDAGPLQVWGSHRLPDRYVERLDAAFASPLGPDALSSSPTARAFDDAELAVVEDAFADVRHRPWRHLAEEFGWRSIVSARLVAADVPAGVLNGYSRQTRRYTPDELDAVRTLASHAAIAVRLSWLIDRQMDTIEQLQQANRELARQRSVLERSHEIHLTLTDAVVSGAGYDEVARRVATLVGRPVSVSAPDGSELALGVAGDQQDEREAEVVGIVVRPIRIGDELLGEVVAHPGPSRHADLDVRAVEHAATVLAVHVAKEREARAAEQRLQSDFVFDLVHGRDDHVRIDSRARHHGVVLDASHRVVVAELGGDDESRTSSSALHAARAVFEERLPGSLVSQVGERLTVLVPAGQTGGDDISVLRRTVDEIRRQPAPLQQSMTVGVGASSRGPAGIATSHREAVRCVEVLRRLGRRDEVMVSDELGILGILVDTERIDDLLALGERVLGPIRRSDERGRGALVETLVTYLELNANVTSTAQRLFVHPNTVKYRIRRVEQLCGVDLRRSEDLLTATVALLSLQLLAPPHEGTSPAERSKGS